MTKYSKIKKSSFAILALSLILVAVLAFGGTYAYFSDNANIGGSATMGILRLSLKDGDTDATQLVESNAILVPNQTIVNAKTYTIDMSDDTNIDYYVRIRFGVEVTGMAGEKGAQEPDAANAVAVTLTNFTQNGTTGYYYLAASTATVDSAKVTAGTTNKTFVLTIKVSEKVGEDGSEYYMGASVAITCTVEAIQANCLEGISETSTVSDLHDAWDGFVSVEPNS